MSHLPQLEHDLATIADRLVERGAVGATAAVSEGHPAASTGARLAADEQTHPSSRASGRERRPRLGVVRPRLLAGLAASAVAAGVGLAALTGGTGSLDIAQEARAALAPDGGILHVVSERSIEFKTNGHRARRAGNERGDGIERSETWIASDPHRWRAAVRPGTIRTNGPNVLLHEIAYAGGAQSTYDGKVVNVVTGFSDRGNAAKPITLGGWSGDLSLEDLRRALADGKLRGDGEATVNGHPALRLTDGASGPGRERITYFVDPTTYAPIRVVYRWEQPRKDLPKTWTSSVIEARTDFSVFERLPSTPENEQLLKIDPPPGTKTTIRTVEQSRKEARARSARILGGGRIVQGTR